jgi:hypothetical protein
MDDHSEHQRMRNSLPLKIIKIILKITVRIFKFSFRIILAALSSDKKTKDFRKWQEDYDEHVKSITRHEPF